MPIRFLPTGFLAGLLAALCAGPAPASGEEIPRRIASFNVCADQLVVALADPGQIAGLSPYAADPALSVVAEAARAFPRLDWQAEATIALQPDLVLIGPNDRSASRRILAAQNLRVVEVGFVADLEAARNQIRDVAALLGHPDRGTVLLAKLDAARDRLAAHTRLAARARLAAHGQLPQQTALVIERGGYMQGPSSLVAALLAEAGLKPPPGAPSGYGGFVPLEKLLLLKPDLIFLKDPPHEATDQGAVYLTHPALRALYPPERRIALPTRYAICGGPALVAAFDYLTDALAAAGQ